jgi:hypothetical protein
VKVDKFLFGCVNRASIFIGLCSMFDFGKLGFVSQKGKTNIIMFVGLQGELKYHPEI